MRLFVTGVEGRSRASDPAPNFSSHGGHGRDRPRIAAKLPSSPTPRCSQSAVGSFDSYCALCDCSVDGEINNG